MLTWNQLYQNLKDASYRHNELLSRFGEFAKLVASKVDEQSFHIKGLTTELHLDQGYFTTTFAGRTIMFIFTSLLEDSGRLKGNIQCYLKKEFPELTHIKIGEVNFNGDGLVDLKMPDQDSIIYIDNEKMGALYVLLHFIHKSLSLRMDAP